MVVRDGKKMRKHKKSRQVKNFYEVDALGDDFIDFGSQSGPKGAFSWHSDFPLES